MSGVTVDKPLTATQHRALSLLYYNPALRYPSEFAHLMWPDSPAWSRGGKCGRNENGLQKGQGIMKAGGAYLAKLEYAGLISCNWPDMHATAREWRLTEDGLRLMREADERQRATRGG